MTTYLQLLRWEEVEKLLIVIICIIMSYTEFKQAIKLRQEKENYGWSRYALGVLAIYWACLYIFLFLRGGNLVDGETSIWFRPEFMLTMGAFASRSIQTWGRMTIRSGDNHDSN